MLPRMLSPPVPQQLVTMLPLRPIVISEVIRIQPPGAFRQTLGGGAGGGHLFPVKENPPPERPRIPPLRRLVSAPAQMSAVRL